MNAMYEIPKGGLDRKWAEYFSFLTTRLEHPTLPVLLTESGPLREQIQCDTSQKKAPPHIHLKFKNRPRLFQSHEL